MISCRRHSRESSAAECHVRHISESLVHSQRACRDWSIQWWCRRSSAVLERTETLEHMLNPICLEWRESRPKTFDSRRFSYSHWSTVEHETEKTRVEWFDECKWTKSTIESRPVAETMSRRSVKYSQWLDRVNTRKIQWAIFMDQIKSNCVEISCFSHQKTIGNTSS